MHIAHTLYCIVLYLFIYIALLAVHTNQKRFQCERPREKRAVLRERKEALGSPVNKMDFRNITTYTLIHEQDRKLLYAYIHKRGIMSLNIIIIFLIGLSITLTIDSVRHLT